MTGIVVGLVVAACGSSPAPSPSPSPSPATQSPTASPSIETSPSPSIETSPSPEVSPSPSPSFPDLPANVARLDGVLTDPTLAAREPLAIMIDDNAVGRGLVDDRGGVESRLRAGDGGEDRYMMVFQEGDANLVGPVRSGRPYFVRWAAEFRAAFGHYGGDAKTLQQVIPQLNGSLLFDVDALRGGGGAYHRISSRQAPHNAYTATPLYRRVSVQVGAPAAMLTGLRSWTFIDDGPLAQRPAGGSITIPYGTGTIGYTYDPAANAYLRSVAGRAQIDANDGTRVTARNVVVLFMRLSTDPQSEPGYSRPVLDQIGSGQAIVYRDGVAIAGTWRKPDVGGLTRFFDSSGQEIALVRGRIFVQVVPTGTRVSSTFR
ncbi:MAG: DUF3048 domain-containing protein [Candidatus Limnocylindrales bacterium]